MAGEKSHDANSKAQSLADEAHTESAGLGKDTRRSETVDRETMASL